MGSTTRHFFNMLLQQKVNGEKINCQTEQVIDGGNKRTRSQGGIVSIPVQDQRCNGSNKGRKDNDAKQCNLYHY